MRILMITPHFPPILTPESVVNAKLARALVGSGVDLNVVTALEYGIKYEDRSPFLNKDLGRITRTPAPIYYRWAKMAGFIDRFSKRKLVLYWYLNRARAFAAKLLQETSFDLLLTRSYPLETIMLGASLKRRFKIKWVAGINDPIPYYLTPWPYTQGRRNPISDYWSCRKTREALSAADGIIFPGQRLGKYLERNLNLQFGPKMIVVPHIGWKKQSGHSQGRQIDILHVGTANSLRISLDFFSYFHKAVQAQALLRNKVRIIFVGNVNESFKTFVKNNGLESFIAFEGQVSYQESLERISEASALLLVEAPLQEGIFLPSKFGDYAVAQKPLLLFSPEQGAISDLVGGYAHPGFLGQEQSRFKEGIDRFLKRLAEGQDLSDYAYPRPWEFEENIVIKNLMDRLRMV